MKQPKIFILLTLFISIFGAKASAHDIIVKNEDGVIIYYKWIKNKTELSVSYRDTYSTKYSNEYSGNVVIPESVEYNGSTYSVTSIDGYAFYDCSTLTSVTIPTSVNSIGNNAFDKTAWYDNQPDGVLYIDNCVIGYKGELSGELIIDEGSRLIANTAFQNCSGLSTVTIPNSVTSIGSAAFQNCSGLSTVTIPNCVTSIGSAAFDGCSGLTSVTIPNSVTSIGSRAFCGCRGLTTVTIPNSVASIDDYAFKGCNGLTSVNYQCSPTSLGDNLFSECNNIKEVTFDCEIVSSSFSGITSISQITMTDKVTSIDDYAFKGCNGLTYVNYQCSPTSFGKGVFGNCTNLQEITFNCERVCSLFQNITTITKITMTDKVISIDDYAFKNCSGLTSVTIPNSVISIGEGTFENCSGLTSVTISNNVSSIESNTFYGCKLTSIVIGTGVKNIASGAFYRNNLKKTIWLTNTPPSGYYLAEGAVNYVSNDQFASLKNTIKYQFLSSYFDIEGVRYVPVSPSERTCDAIDYLYDATDLKIGPTVSYKGVTMTVKNIQPYLAYNNKYIKTLTIDCDGELANYAFANCSNLTNVQLSEKITAIGTNVFQGCSSLSSVTALDSNSSLNGLYISKAINSIGDYAFDGCSELKNIIMSDSEEELKLGSNGKNPLFASCLLDSVYIGRKISYNTSSNYGYSPFYRNTSLRAVKITDKETEISANEFYGCTNLQRVIIGDGVTAIGDWAFSGCSSLKYFAFGTQVQAIGKEAFSDCAAVVEIISKASVAPTCGAQALDDINKWNCKLYVPDGCLAAYQSADQWKDFFFLEEGQGTIGQGEEQNKGKCEAPTICLKDGKLLFESKTSGVIFHYSITHSDVKNDITNGEVPLTNTYIISAYASKEGYEDSDVVNAQIEVKGGGNGDVNGDGVVDAADVVKVTNIIMGK